MKICAGVAPQLLSFEHLYWGFAQTQIIEDHNLCRHAGTIVHMPQTVSTMWRGPQTRIPIHTHFAQRLGTEIWALSSSEPRGNPNPVVEVANCLQFGLELVRLASGMLQADRVGVVNGL